MPKHKRKQKNKGSNVLQADLKPEKDVETLLEEAESAIDTFNYEEAAQKLREVLRVNEENTKALEMLSGILIEQSEFDEAQKLLQQCINLSPDLGHSKYFSLAQLCDGEEAVALFEKGIQIVEKQLENSENIIPSKDTDRKSLNRNLSDAYCSIAQIFMTDCCFAENAEEKCLSAIQNSISSDPTNPEAFQCYADFHLVKEQIQEAKDCMVKSLSLWLPHHEAVRDGEVCEEFLMPSYDSRIRTAKLLIELQMYDEATTILDGLLEEDDEVAEVWYLQGVSNYMQGDEYKLNAHFYLNRANEVWQKLNLQDAEFLPEVQELLEELRVAFPLDDFEAQEQECDVSSSGDEMDT